MTPKDIQGRLRHLQDEINCLATMLPAHYRIEFALLDQEQKEIGTRKRLAVNVAQVESAAPSTLQTHQT